MNQIAGTSSHTETRNAVTDGASVHGALIQAGQITGDIHVHPGRPDLPVPRQVPPVPVTFTDRRENVAALSAWIREHSSYVRAVVVHGVPGVGKTTLAARLLDDLRGAFPAGQLYADLQGAAPGPGHLTDVLGRLLRSLYVGRLPSGVEERAAWWRSVTAGCEQPLAVLLDNARAEQVRVLMPGGRGHLVVVTSRDPLHELARDGALVHRLDPLAPAAAVEYLAHFAGNQRIAEAPDAARRIAALSAGLPLALGLAGGELAAHPALRLSAVADVMEVSHRRHSARPLAPTGVAVISSLDRAYAALPPPAARFYRCLGPLFTPDVDAAFTAAVAGLPPEEAEQNLRVLHNARLLEVKADDAVRGRVYAFHDEVRGHARARAEAEATDGEIEERLRRGLEYLLSTITAAERLLTPHHRHVARTYRYPQPKVPFADETGATAWLEACSGHFLPAVRAADACGLHATTWQLTHALWCWLRLTHDYDAWSESHQLAAHAARADGDSLAEREILGSWGIGLRGEKHYDTAIEKFTDVLALARTAGDGRGTAQALHELGVTHLAAGNREAADGFLRAARGLRQELHDSAEDPALRQAHLRSVALSTMALGEIAISVGNPAEAVTLLTRARDILAPQDPLDAARATAWLGRAHALAGDVAAAESEGRTAIAACTALRTPRWVARSHELLGHTLLEAGRQAEALDLLQQAQSLFTPISRSDAERVEAVLRTIR
ncbi:tetratricopeptide repeat protein [Streptomyces anthocyanicus]|uniref:tetratricopeptide repeat protein n=1 Tax=Streptomyces anthocyanicus TaxID=68174 RepID=UPI0037FEDF25